MASVEIGEIELRREETFEKTFQTAAWFERGLFQPQTVPLRLVDDYWLCATLDGVTTASDFSSLFGGVRVGKGKVDENAGKTMEFGVQMNTYLVADMLNPVEADKRFLVRLNDLGKEKLRDFLPQQDDESIEDYAKRFVGRRENAQIEHVTMRQIPQPDSLQQVRTFFDGDDFYCATLQVREGQRNPYENPVVLLAKFAPTEFSDLFKESARIGIEQTLKEQVANSPEYPGYTVRDHAFVAEPDATTIVSLRALVDIEGETFQIRTDLKAPVARYNLGLFAVGSALAADGTVLPDQTAEMSEKLKSAYMSMCYRSVSRYNMPAEATLLEMMKPVTLIQYETMLNARREMADDLEAGAVATPKHRPKP